MGGGRHAERERADDGPARSGDGCSAAGWLRCTAARAARGRVHDRAMELRRPAGLPPDERPLRDPHDARRSGAARGPAGLRRGGLRVLHRAAAARAVADRAHGGVPVRVARAVGGVHEAVHRPACERIPQDSQRRVLRAGRLRHRVCCARGDVSALRPRGVPSIRAPLRERADAGVVERGVGGLLRGAALGRRAAAAVRPMEQPAAVQRPGRGPGRQPAAPAAEAAGDERGRDHRGQLALRRDLLRAGVGPGALSARRRRWKIRARPAAAPGGAAGDRRRAIRPGGAHLVRRGEVQPRRGAVPQLHQPGPGRFRARVPGLSAGEVPRGAAAGRAAALTAPCPIPKEDVSWPKRRRRSATTISPGSICASRRS
ncbi:MAG: hypothetical protein AB1716_16620 [Planctomycetota bacterium]